MNVIIRTDASLDMGIGHLNRCLTLAEALQELGANVEFIIRHLSGDFFSLIIEKQFKYRLLKPITTSNKATSLYKQWLGVSQAEDAHETITLLNDFKPDWIIIDHYALDATWEDQLKLFCKKIMVIDDLANRKHNCDLLLDQSYTKNTLRYQNLVPSQCQLLLGSQYALLRSEFKDNRALSEQKNNHKIKRILITMGSIDPKNNSQLIIEALMSISWISKPVLNVILSNQAPNLKELKAFVAQSDFTTEISSNVKTMAKHMLNSDLAIGAGGTSSWERCCMGLPSIIIIEAENQQLIGEELQKAGATITFQDDAQLKSNIIKSIKDLLSNKTKLLSMSKASALLCDGTGAQKVAHILTKTDIVN